MLLNFLAELRNGTTEFNNVSSFFYFYMSVHGKYISKLQPTRCNFFSIYLFLGCSYRASSVSIVIRLPTDATLYFVYYFFYFTLHVSGSHKPIIRGVSSCFFIYNHLVHVVFMLLICVCLWTGLS